MHIRRVVLEHVKTFEHVDFRFESGNPNGAGWHVITGENASGKTTLLKAIALALVGPDLTRGLQPSLDGWIRSGSESATVAVEIVPDREDTFRQGRRYEKSFWSEIQMLAARSETSIQPGKRYRRKGKGPTNGPWDDNTHGWFALGYGPFRRLYGSSPEAQRLMSNPGRISNFATMFREDATLGECEFWLKELHYKSLEKREGERQLLNSALEILNDDFLSHGVTIDHVDSDGVWLRDSNGFVLPLQDMSEGYRAALAMLMDIIRQMALAYGVSNLTQHTNGVVSVPHPGIVLIDEADAHLHPRWQRTLGFWLKRRFPNVQFLVSTHSAFICQAADRQSIYHLPQPSSGQQPFRVSEEDYRKTIRSTPDTIYLSPIFGLKHTRSDEAVRARERFAKLRSKEREVPLDSAEQTELKQLTLFVDEGEYPNDTLQGIDAAVLG